MQEVGVGKATQRHPLTSARLRPCIPAALSIGLLGIWLWGGTASAESASPGGGPVQVESLGEEVPDTSTAARGSERQPAGADTATLASGEPRPTSNPPAVLGLSGEVAEEPPQLASPDARRPTSALGTSEKVEGEHTRAASVPNAEAVIMTGQPYPETMAPSGTGGEAAAVDRGRAQGGDMISDSSLFPESAVAPDTGQETVRGDGAGPVGPGVEEPAEIVPLTGPAVPAVSAPGSLPGIYLASQGNAPSLPFPGPLPRVVGAASERNGDGAVLGAGDGSWQGRTSDLGAGLRTLSGHGPISADITTGTSTTTGNAPLSTGFLFAGPTAGGSSVTHGSGGGAPLRFLAAIALGAAAALLAGLAHARLRSNTIQGAVAGAGPPPPTPRLIRPAPCPAPASFAPAGPLLPPLALLFLAPIRRPDPASRSPGSPPRCDRWPRAGLGAPRLRSSLWLAHRPVVIGERRSRWQRLHCALSPPPSAQSAFPPRRNPAPRVDRRGPSTAAAGSTKTTSTNTRRTFT